MLNERPQLPFGDRGVFSAQSVIAIAIVLAALGFALGFFTAARAGGGQAVAGAPEGVDFAPVWKAWQIIDEKFVPASVATSTPVASTTEESDQDRVWGMIGGLAQSLNDPYTFFLPPVENQQFTEDLSGAFEGVGMEIAVRDQVLTVVSPLKGTPADRVGIKSGDKVIKIDGTETRGMDISKAVSRIRGSKGTVVTLLVVREGWSEPREIKVTRDVINVPVITTTARETASS